MNPNTIFNLFLFALVTAIAVTFVNAQDVQPNVVSSILSNAYNSKKLPNTDQKVGKVDKKEHPQVFITCIESTRASTNELEERRLAREDNDLAQQTIMAIASKKAASYTLWGLVISGVALLITLGVSVFSFIQANRSHQRAIYQAATSHIQSLAQAKVIHDQTIAEMRRAEAATKEKDQIQMRAYISTDVKIMNFHELNEAYLTSNTRIPFRPVYNLEYKNVGTTPAHKVSIRNTFVVDSYPSRNEALFKEKVDAANFISQSITVGQGTVNNAHIIPKLDLPPSIIAMIKNRQLAIYVAGVITYEDVFGNKWKSGFRYSHKVLEETEGFGNEIHIEANGNEAT